MRDTHIPGVNEVLKTQMKSPEETPVFDWYGKGAEPVPTSWKP